MRILDVNLPFGRPKTDFRGEKLSSKGQLSQSSNVGNREASGPCSPVSALRAPSGASTKGASEGGSAKRQRGMGL